MVLVPMVSDPHPQSKRSTGRPTSSKLDIPALSQPGLQLSVEHVIRDIHHGAVDFKLLDFLLGSNVSTAAKRAASCYIPGKKTCVLQRASGSL